MIKDFYNNFIDCAALFVLKAFPIQFKSGILETKDEFSKAMEYEKMNKDFEKSSCKLIAHYERMGFEIIPAVHTELMFINPSWINEKFDKIILD